jgi:hypothetical protein
MWYLCLGRELGNTHCVVSQTCKIKNKEKKEIFYSICSNLQINKFIPQIWSSYVKIQINFSPPFFIIYAVLYYICNFRVSNYVTEIISPNPPFQYIISHTKYKFNSADCPWTHSCILTLLFITMTLTTTTINLCHTVYCNFKRGCLPCGTPLYRKFVYVWNVVFGIL